MKFLRILLVIAIGFLVAQCGDNDKKSSEESKSQDKVPATSKVKTPQNTSAAQMSGKAKPGFATKMERGQKRRESIVDTYDEKGNIIERRDQVYDKFGNVKKKNRYTYVYDDADNRIEQCYYAYSPNDELLMWNKNILTYNSKGLQTENIFISYDANNNEVNWAQNIYTHNADGRIISDMTKNKAGIPLRMTIYNIENGMLVSENFVDYDEKGNVIKKKTMEYSETGKVLNTFEE